MRSLFIGIVILFSLIFIGCTSIVTSNRPINLYKVGNDKSNYMVLDGIPYLLPISKIHVDITWTANESNWAVAITPVIQPDPDFRFILRPDSNALFDDNINLAVDSNGLLQTVNTTITDKTVSSMADLVAAAGSALTFGAALSPVGQPVLKGRKAEKAIPPPPLPLYSFHKDFDPYQDYKKPIKITLYSPPSKPADKAPNTDKNSNQADNLAIPVKADFTLKIKPLIEPSDLYKPNTPDKDSPIDRIVGIDSDTENIHGIVVRIPIPYQIDITATVSESDLLGTAPKYSPSGPIEQSKVLMLPDKANNFVLPISRRYLVSDQTNVTLKDGMIQSIQQSRPSMVAGVVGIPKTILGALVPIPLQIRQSQTNNLQAIDNSLKAKADIKNLQSQ